MDKLVLELGQINENNDGEMDGDRIVIYQVVRCLFGSWDVWNLKKSFGVNIFARHVRVLVGLSQIMSIITCMELQKDTGRMVLVEMVVASLVAMSASSLPGKSEWPVIHWMKMEEKMELMEVWIEEARGFDDMRASHKDFLSVQKRMVIEGWLAVVEVQVKADSMAGASSS